MPLPDSLVEKIELLKNVNRRTRFQTRDLTMLCNGIFEYLQEPDADRDELVKQLISVATPIQFLCNFSYNRARAIVDGLNMCQSIKAENDPKHEDRQKLVLAAIIMFLRASLDFEFQYKSEFVIKGLRKVAESASLATIEQIGFIFVIFDTIMDNDDLEDEYDYGELDQDVHELISGLGLTLTARGIKAEERQRFEFMMNPFVDLMLTRGKSINTGYPVAALDDWKEIMPEAQVIKIIQNIMVYFREEKVIDPDLEGRGTVDHMNHHCALLAAYLPKTTEVARENYFDEFLDCLDGIKDSNLLSDDEERFFDAVYEYGTSKVFNSLIPFLDANRLQRVYNMMMTVCPENMDSQADEFIAVTKRAKELGRFPDQASYTAAIQEHAAKQTFHGDEFVRSFAFLGDAAVTKQALETLIQRLGHDRAELRKHAKDCLRGDELIEPAFKSNKHADLIEKIGQIDTAEAKDLHRSLTVPYNLEAGHAEFTEMMQRRIQARPN